MIAIGIDEAYGTVDLDDMKIGTFTPAGGASESGQFAVLAVDGNFRSTGVALYRAGDWLVKVRISSRQLSVTRMDETLRANLMLLPVLDDLDSSQVPFLAECENSLEFADANAVESDLGMLAIGQAVSVTAEQNVEHGEMPDDEFADLGIEDRGSINYCREGQRGREFNIYRPVGTQDRYTVGVGDAGFSIEVYPDLVGTEIDSDGSGDTVYIVRSASGLDVKLHTPFRGLPNLNQVSQSATRGPTIASINRPLFDGDERRISINPDLP